MLTIIDNHKLCEKEWNAKMYKNANAFFFNEPIGCKKSLLSDVLSFIDPFLSLSPEDGLLCDWAATVQVLNSNG